MANSLTSYLLTATPKAAADLEAALLRLPEDKRNWCPMLKARTALDQIAECALLNGGTAEMLRLHAFPESFDMATYPEKKAALAADESAAVALLRENTANVIAALQDVSEEDLAVEIGMPWGPMTLAQIAAYPFWNMCYHEGQINYIASMLGCLE
ncbi:MAG: DinB family protein [Capsulimonadaceae bacterium]